MPFQKKRTLFRALIITGLIHSLCLTLQILMSNNNNTGNNMYNACKQINNLKGKSQFLAVFCLIFVAALFLYIKKSALLKTS